MLKSAKTASVLAAAVCVSIFASDAKAALSFNVGGTWDTQARKDAATAAIQAVVNRYNSYGNFGNYNIYVYYDAGIPTAQANYLGSIGFGGTYPNERVTQHESNHYLGSGTTSNWTNKFSGGLWTGAKMNALVAQFDGDGTVIHQSGVHFYGYGLNYDSEVVNSSVLMRNIALMYAQRQDDGLGPAADPWSATSVTMTQSDAIGTSGFNYFGGWNDGYFVHPNAAYSTGAFTLRTPLDTYTASAATPNFTFAGDSLTVPSGGVLLYKGVGTTGLLTFKNLILDGGLARHASGSGDLFQIAGKMSIASASTIAADQGAIRIAATITGSGNLTKTGSFGLTLTGVNTQTGTMTVSAGTLQLGDGTSGNDGTLASSGISLGGGTTLIFNRFGTPAAAAQVISGAGGITKLGVGTQILTAANTYTGATTISAGTLQLGDGTTGRDGTLGGTNISVASGAVLAFNRFGTPAAATQVISGAGGVTKLGIGTQTLSGANTYTGTTTVAAGTLRATSPAYSNLLSNAGGVDLGEGTARFVLDYAGTTSPVNTVQTLLNASAASNFASGKLRSTTLGGGHTIGYADDGQNLVTLRVTLPGDADLNGVVDFNDFLALQNNFGNANTRFDQGNFNYDGVTDFNDFLALQNNFGQSITGAVAATLTRSQVAAITAFANSAAVPEPASAAVIVAGAFGVLSARRARRPVTA